MKKSELYHEITRTLMGLFDDTDAYKMRIERGNIYISCNHNGEEYRVRKYEIGEYDEVGDIYWKILKYMVERVCTVESLENGTYDIRETINNVEGVSRSIKNKIIDAFEKKDKKDKIWSLAVKLDYSMKELFELYPELKEEE